MPKTTNAVLDYVKTLDGYNQSLAGIETSRWRWKFIAECMAVEIADYRMKRTEIEKLKDEIKNLQKQNKKMEADIQDKEWALRKINIKERIGIWDENKSMETDDRGVDCWQCEWCEAWADWGENCAECAKC